jgi:hypothetical protein
MSLGASFATAVRKGKTAFRVFCKAIAWSLYLAQTLTTATNPMMTFSYPWLPKEGGESLSRQRRSSGGKKEVLATILLIG